MRALGYPKDLELFRFAIADTPNTRLRLDSIVANTAADYDCIWITDNDKVDVIIPPAKASTSKSDEKQQFSTVQCKRNILPIAY